MQQVLLQGCPGSEETPSSSFAGNRKNDHKGDWEIVTIFKALNHRGKMVCTEVPCSLSVLPLRTMSERAGEGFTLRLRPERGVGAP